MHLSMSSRRGIGWDFDIFQKVAVKFPTPGQKCEVKYNLNSPPREMICGQMFAGHSKKDAKILETTRWCLIKSTDNIKVTR